MNPAPRYQVRIESIHAETTAVVKDVAFARNIGERIMAGSPRVYEALVKANAPKPGLNVVAYLADEGGRWDQAPGIAIEVGVLVADSTPVLQAPVVYSSLPAGRVATTTHWGAYDELSAAHEAVRDHCSATGVELTGRNWEIYGHWSDDPHRRRTDVYYLLR